MRADEETLLDTIGRIYAAAAGLSDWNDALNAISDVCGVANTAFVVNDRALQIAEVRTPRADPAVIAAYENRWWRYDPTIPATAGAAVGAITSLDTTGREVFLRSEFHNEFWARSGLGADRLASNLLLSADAFGSLVLQNGPRQTEICPDTHRAFGLILPHMIRAVEILRKLEGLSVRRIAAMQAGAAQADSVIVVDAARRPIARDAGFEQAMRDHACLRMDAGRLDVADGHFSRLFGRLIDGCTSQGLGSRGGTLRIPDASGHFATTLTVIPWRADGGPEALALLTRPAALILVEDGRHRQDRKRAAFQQQYGLTPAETRLAFELLQGGTRTEIAARLGVSLSTVRTHLSHIFDKTGTRRQSELVALLLHAD